MNSEYGKGSAFSFEVPIGHIQEPRNSAPGTAVDTLADLTGKLIVVIDDESAIAAIVDEMLVKHADAVEQYKKGKAASFGFLVGQVMKAAGGKANPRRVSELLKQRLEP